MMHSSGTRRTASRSRARSFALALVTACTCGLTGASAAPASFSFGPATDYQVGEFPQAVAIGDLNGDGHPDMAVANWISSDVSVLLANPGGGFAAATNYPVDRGPNSVAIGDLNRDGRPDLATSNLNADSVSVLLAAPGGGFEPATHHAVGEAPVSVAIGDLNADGRPDLAASNTFSDDVSILLAGPAGGFGSASSYGVGSRPQQVAIRDLDADGRLDVAVATEAGLSLLRGQGAGGLAAPESISAGTKPISIAVGELNGDGRPDLAVANFDPTTPPDTPGTVTVLLATAAGGFRAPTSHPAGPRPLSIGMADFDGDSRNDLAVTNSGNSVSVLIAKPAGGFAAPVSRSWGEPWALAAGDLNGDGWPDLAVTHSDGTGLSVLPNTAPPIARVSIEALAFGLQHVGTLSLSQTVTVTSSGASPLRISSVTVVGAESDAFRVSGDGCTAEAVEPGASCELEVRFAPLAPGHARAVLRVASNAPGSPATIALAGVGVPLPVPLDSPRPPDVPVPPELPLPRGPAGRNPAITCKRAKSGFRKAQVTCSVKFTAADGSRLLAARLAQGGKIYASRRLNVRGGPGKIALRARRAIPTGRYRLALTFYDREGERTTISQVVRVRR